MLKQIIIKPLPVLLGLAMLGPFLLGHKTALAANPTTINFQGKVVNAADGTNISNPNGTYSIVFRIYNTSSPTMSTACSTTSSCLWQETQSSVTLSNGIFQVQLGSACALTSNACNNTAGGPINFANSNSLYLTMQFAGDTSGSNGGFMYPLIQITSVPFALQADNAAALNGLASGNFVQLAQGLQTDASTTNASIAINKTGSTANILTLQKAGANVLLLDNNGLLTLQPAASLTNGQSALTQIFTAANATASGVVNGYSQTITVSNTTAGTTNGINLSLTDNTALGNTNRGISVALSGSNTSAIQYGVDASANVGIGVRGISSGKGGSVTCGGITGSGSVGVCGNSSDTTAGDTAVGVLGTTTNGDTNTATLNGGVVGYNTAAGTASGYFAGVRGISNQTAAAAYGSIGVYGKASGGSGATMYGGFFTLGTGGATGGAALYATNSTVAANIMQLQNGNVNALVVNSSGQLVLGQSNTGGANGTIVFNNSSGTGTAAITLAGNPTTSYTYQLPTSSVSNGQCLQSGTVSGSTVPLTFGSCGSSGGVTTVGTFSASSQTNGASIAGSTITFGPADTTNPGMVTASGTQTFGGTKTFTGAVNVQNASGLSVGATGVQGVLSLYSGSSSTIGTITFASGASYSIILPASSATAAGQCLTSTGSNGTLQWLPCGAGSTRTVTLVPEYPGAVMTGSGGSNTGTMTSDFCSGSGTGGLNINASICGTGSASHNYYSWTANATNNYDIWVRWQAPSDFSSFGSNAFTLNGWTTSASDSAALTVYDSSNTSCGTATISTASTAFTTAAITPSGCSVSAGSVLTLKVHLNVGVNGEYARAGEITIVYIRN